MQEIEILDHLIEAQKKSYLECASRINPRVTYDDLLQPNDFPELENNPILRYEEGILHGLLKAKATLLTLKEELSSR